MPNVCEFSLRIPQFANTTYLYIDFSYSNKPYPEHIVQCAYYKFIKLLENIILSIPQQCQN